MLKKRILKKRILSGVFSCLLAASLSTCQVPVAAESAGEPGTAMGRYLESEISFSDITGELMIILDITSTRDGKLRVVAQSQNEDRRISLWESSDSGETWEQVAVLPDDIDDYYYTEIALNSEGGGAGAGMLFGEGSDDYEMYYVSFDAQGNTQSIPFPEVSFHGLYFTGDDQLVGLAWGSKAYSLDRETGDVIHEFPAENVLRIGTCGSETILLTNSQILRFDTESGEPLERDEALENALFSGNETYDDETSFGHKIVFTQDADGRLYYCTGNGIFAHQMGGSVVEQIVDGNLCSLSDPNISPTAMAVAGNEFLVAYMDWSRGSVILHYTYDPDTPSQPEKELTVYSLKEDSGLRQTITAFQKEHPDTFINYEIGVSQKDGVTVADALRTLNTDILAGNGPDVMIFDEISVDTYEEKGLLTDLSPVIDEIKNEEGILEPIADAWQKEDGKIPAVPIRFGFPLALGRTELLDRLSDFTSLEELAQETGTIDYITALQLPEILYYTCANGWKNEDHTIDQEKLTDYVSAVKQIYDHWRENETNQMALQLLDMEEEWIDDLREGMAYFGDLKSAGMELMQIPDRLQMGILLDIRSYAGICSAENALENCGIRTFEPVETGLFLPLSTVGILNTSRDVEEAEVFVRFLLSKEGELANSFDGFPVNRAALEELLYTNPYKNGDTESEVGEYYSSENIETGEMIELAITWPKQEQLDWLMETIEGLTTCAETERVQMETITQEVRRCLKAEIGVEEAVNSIMQKINLYLAENAG